MVCLAGCMLMLLNGVFVEGLSRALLYCDGVLRTRAQTGAQAVAKLLTDGDHGLKMRPLETGALSGLPKDGAGFAAADDAAAEAARGAILDNVMDSCGKKLSDALEVQAKHSAGFMTTKHCRGGRVGAEYTRTKVD